MPGWFRSNISCVVAFYGCRQVAQWQGGTELVMGMAWCLNTVGRTRFVFVKGAAYGCFS
ncbi:hypothetical protein L195_g035242 [Trifolium pratense]|uniref:Uncharacterized protein n=1 Tax=Trifolium pratense TaxID=57577 RepID=A0A2K3LL37_TRIPR|nr:hypothetical protein L195_g035242 [Trifolium pratense]